ncbi:MAG: hypothetical protein Q8O89_09095 [Nanoarchaeota archaeon]|nr:hypothetical protein [Nanoarchaeota archaeon]
MYHGCFFLLVIFIFFVSASSAQAITCICRLTAGSPSAGIVVLSESTNTGNSDCDCAASCFDSNNNLKDSCNRPDLNGWPRPSVTFYYWLSDAAHTPYPSTTCITPSCTKTGDYDYVSYTTTLNLAPYANPDTDKEACQLKVPNGEWGPDATLKSPQAKCCGSETTNIGAILTRSINGVLRYYVCAPGTGAYTGKFHWTPQADLNGVIISSIPSGADKEYDVVFMGSGIYTCNNPFINANINYGTAGVIVMSKPPSTVTHQYVCNEESQFFECKGLNGVAYNVLPGEASRSINQGGQINIAGIDYLCTGSASSSSWKSKETILEGAITDKTACEFAEGDWTGSKCCYKQNQYHNENPASPNTLGGCWNGVMVDKGTIVSGTEDKIFNDNGIFYGCNIGGQYGSAATGLLNLQQANSCAPKTGYYCDIQTGKWKSGSDFGSDLPMLTTQNVPSAYVASLQQGMTAASCCPRNKCWNGFACTAPEVRQKGYTDSYNKFYVLISGPQSGFELINSEITNMLITATDSYVCSVNYSIYSQALYGAQWKSYTEISANSNQNLCLAIAGDDSSKGWTGSKCCFKPGQYYSDTSTSAIGGCWDGTIIKKGNIVTGKPRYLNIGGRFIECDNPAAKFPDGNPMLNNYACVVTATGDSSHPYYYCRPKAVGAEAGEWIDNTWHVVGNDPVNSLGFLKPLPTGVTYEQAESSYPSGMCCPKSYCWNGTKCVSGDITQENLFVSNTSIFRCSNVAGSGTWLGVSYKYDWDNNVKGICNSNAKCLVPYTPEQMENNPPTENSDVNPYLYTSSKPPRCIGGNIRSELNYIADHYCQTGNWTTRTKFVALKLINYTQSKNPESYSLFCGTYDEVLNYLSYSTITNVYDANLKKNVPITTPLRTYFGTNAKSPARVYNGAQISECYGEDCVNNVCVLKMGDQIVFGASLNQDIEANDQTNTIMSVFSNYGKVQKGSCLPFVGSSLFNIKAAGYRNCGGSGNLWYDASMRIAIYSGTPILLEAPTFVDFVQSPLNFLRLLFQKAFEGQSSAQQSEVLAAIDNVQNFNKIYYAKSGDKEVRGLIENKFVGNDEYKTSYIALSMDFINVAGDLCGVAKNHAEQLYLSSDAFKCSVSQLAGQNTTSLSIAVYNTEDMQYNLDSLWKELTKIKLQ